MGRSTPNTKGNPQLRPPVLDGGAFLEFDWPRLAANRFMVSTRSVALILALITLVLYLPVGTHDFLVFDDDDYVTNNRVVLEGLTIDGIKWAFTTFHASNWHPLTWISHMLDQELFGPNPGPQHLISVLFHIASAILLFNAFRRLIGELWPAALIAALFAWHPMHVESVAWLSERKDVLSTFFGLLSLNAYVASVQNPTNRPRAFGLALFFFALSLMSKPMLVTLPFVFLLLDIWPLQRLASGKPAKKESGIKKSFGALCLEKWPFFAFTLASSVVTVLAQRAEAIVDFEHQPLSARIANAIVAYARYVLKLFWPVDLAVLYPLRQNIPIAEIVFAAAALGFFTWFALRNRRDRPFILIGWLWFLGTLVPVIGLVQVGGQSMADRYSYIPSIGIFLIVALGARDLVRRWKPPVAVCAALASMVLAGCCFGTWFYLRYWRTSETLFARTAAVTRDNDVAMINLGVALEYQGRNEEAMEQYRRALKLNPRRVHAHNNLANLLANDGRYGEALEFYNEAIRLRPDAPLTRMNFGTALVEMGRVEDALDQYAEAARLDPKNPRPFYLTGKARLRQGRSVDAVESFRRALAIDSNDYQTLTFLARVLAADNDPSIRNATEAIRLAERANEISGGEQPFVLDTLAAAYAEGQRFDDAIAAARKAIDLARAAELAGLVTSIETRLRLYENRRPWREDFTIRPGPD